MRIAIDGPAASGKSTLGYQLAQWLGYLYFDTGVMYRAVTLASIRQGIDLYDAAAVTQVAHTINIEVLPATVQDSRQYTVLVDGEDVTWNLRQKEVDEYVSIPSANAAVRQEMVRQQRRIASRGNVVMVGRDIGTVVLEDADLKIYLDASVEERARRRFDELIARGQPADYDQVLVSMKHRDDLDSTRRESPLVPASDAIIVDSTGLRVDEVLEKLRKLVQCAISE